MAVHVSFSLSLFFLANLLFLHQFSAAAKKPTNISSSFNRYAFPKGFIFGAGSSAYQYEGAANEGGRRPSIWDTFIRQFPERIADRSNADVSNDFYHRYKEDVQLMKYIGLNGFRISISWSRVLPYGKLSKGVNKEGIAFYNNLINELLANGIQPFVTIFHWDTPQALEDEYGGFLSPRIVDDFLDFAELCFKEFGDRVKHWVTVYEPWAYATGGYDSSTFMGTLAPGRCSAWMNNGCPAGDSSTEPYLVGHHLLLAHATAVKIYRDKFKAYQRGQVGIALVTHWMIPLSNSEADIRAAQRALDFFYGWYLDPITFGDYPKIMRSTVGKRLPKFTPEESKLVKGSMDFLGVIYYTTNYASSLPTPNTVNISYSVDFQVNLTTERNGKSIGSPTGIPIFFSYPRGLKQLLLYTKEKYNNPVMYVAENGFGETNAVNSVEEGTNDPGRLSFYRDHILSVKAAIEAGANVKGFFSWTFLDTFEWGSGYTLRFGLYFVDFRNLLVKYPKRSALWLKKFLS